MIFDNAIRNREPQAGALAVSLAGKERFKQMLEHFRRHAATIIADVDDGPVVLAEQLHHHGSTGLEAIEAIGDEVEELAEGRDELLG